MHIKCIDIQNTEMLEAVNYQSWALFKGLVIAVTVKNVEWDAIPNQSVTHIGLNS